MTRLNIKFLNAFICMFLPCIIYAAEYAGVAYEPDQYLTKTSSSSSIKPGYGYFAEENKIISIPCYDVQVSYSDLEGAIKLDNGLSSGQLEDLFKYSGSANFKIGLLSADAEAQYLKSITDSDTSFSLSYTQYAVGNANVEFKSGGVGALNDFGKSIYQKPKFKAICGDSIFTSVKQGALLILSVNIQFADSSQKRAFQAHMGGGLGNIFTIISNVQKAAERTNTNAKVTILGYQKGGDPIRLAAILNKDANGNYYSATCTARDMNNCINIANGLLNYALDSFPKQYSFSEQKGLASFGLTFSDYLPIEYLGL